MLKNKLITTALVLITLLWAFPDVKAIYINRRISQSVVMLTNKAHFGGGTGFELSYGKHQFTVTNSHVCEIGQKDGYLEARSPFTEPKTLKILNQSPYTDLCILEPIKELPALKMRMGDLNLRDAVSIWGHPRLRPLTVTRGKVTIKSYWIDVPLFYITDKESLGMCRMPKHRVVPWIVPVCVEHVRAQKVTAQIEPGNSGSPVLDSKNHVSGVAFAGRDTGEPTSDAEIIPWASLYIFLMNYTQEYVDLTGSN